jgi:ubiquitin carboxyl-terminal hydrolase L3
VIRDLNCSKLYSVQESAQQGSTAAPEASADVDLHFNAFVLDGDDQLWELDGRMPGPIAHGGSSREMFLRDVARIVRRDFVEKSDSQNFSLMALAAS